MRSASFLRAHLCSLLVNEGRLFVVARVTSLSLVVIRVLDGESVRWPEFLVDRRTMCERSSRRGKLSPTHRVVGRAHHVPGGYLGPDVYDRFSEGGGR